MLALLEHMFYDLNLVTEFRINGSVLKKWLVSELYDLATFPKNWPVSQDLLQCF